MKNLIEKMPTGNNNQEDEQLKEVIAYVKDNGITSEEMLIAHKLALGFKPEEATKEKEIRKEVSVLAKSMDDLMREGMPVDYFVRLIKTKTDYESMCDNYNALVNAMQIGEKEKMLLHSIVDKKRIGIVSIVNAKNFDIIDEIEIPKEYGGDEYSPNDFAGKLINFLGAYKDQNIGISFSEL
jgi:hypothetical protein